MKLITWILATIHMIVYAYAVWMTYLHPELIIWGWICVYIFSVGSIWGVKKIPK
jgi:hypothetical protein